MNLEKPLRNKDDKDIIIDQAKKIMAKIKRENALIDRSRKNLRKYWEQIVELALKYCTFSRPINGVKQAYQITDFAKEINVPVTTIRAYINDHYLIQELGSFYNPKQIAALKDTQRLTKKKDPKEKKVQVYLEQLRRDKTDRLLDSYVHQLKGMEFQLCSKLVLSEVYDQGNIEVIKVLTTKISSFLEGYTPRVGPLKPINGKESNHLLEQ